MLRRIPLRRFDGALMRLRRPTAACSHRRLLSDSPAAATAAAAAAKDQRRWVMLSRYGSRTNESFVADSKTIAEARTSTGRLLRVSLREAAPPASSKLYYDFPQEGGGNDNELGLNVDWSQQGELFVLEMGLRDNLSPPVVEYTPFANRLLEIQRQHGVSPPVDHFVYMPAGAAQLPSLSLLPVRDFLTKSESSFAPHMVQPPVIGNTGLLRRGKNDVLVVQVDIWFDRDAPRDRRRLMAEFCVLRPGMRQWELMEPVPILHDQGSKGDELILKKPKYAVSVGDRFLCWVNVRSGFVLCDMADEASPKARFVPFPDEVSCCGDGDSSDDENDDHAHDILQSLFLTLNQPKSIGMTPENVNEVISSWGYESDNDYDDDDDDDDDDNNSCDDAISDSGCDNDDADSGWGYESDDDDDPSIRFMATGGNRNVRLVSVDPHGVSGFTIKTWTMNLGTDEPLAWVKDGEIDSEELWELPGYEGLPRLRQEDLRCTLVCFFGRDNPDVIGLLVCNDFTSRDEKVWMIQLNMKTKTLLSAVQSFTHDPWRSFFHLPLQLQY